MASTIDFLFVFAVRDESIAGRPIDFVRLGSLDEALELAKTDKTVMLLVATLEEAVAEMGPHSFKASGGSRLRSKRQILEKRRGRFLKFDPQPGQTFGQPPKSSLLGLTLSSKLLEYKDIHRGQWNGFRSPRNSDFDYSKDAVERDFLSFSPFADETLNLIRIWLLFSKHRKKGFDSDESSSARLKNQVLVPQTGFESRAIFW